MNLNQIFQAISSGVIVTDSKGQITLFNQKAEGLTGFSADRAVGTDIRLVFPEDIGFIRCLKTGQAQFDQLATLNKNQLSVDVTPLSTGGKLLGTVGNLRVLESRESAVLRSEPYKQLRKQLDAIIKGSSDGLWIYDNKGKVININTVSEMINGVKAKDVIGKSIYELMDEGIFEGVVTPEILRTKRQFSTMSYINKTQKRVLVTGTPILDEDGNVSLIVSNERDLTHWNAVKEDLEQSRRVAAKYKDELEELSLLELKQQEIVAASQEMRQVLRIGVKLARMGASNILIQGESGTGKGLLAKFIHDNGNRKSKPFIQINCAALPESLLEAELFGYEKGAFTGAKEQGKIGLFELAHEGTLFLDEIGDIPLSVQAKLLKYLDDQEILPLGGIRHKKVDCCVIAATNRDLQLLTQQERFRQDLFFRLNSFMIQIPPLRRRPMDVIRMTEYFLNLYNRQYQVRRRMTPEAILRLQAYEFPGNVRELQNIIRNAVVLSENDVLDDFFAGSMGSGPKTSSKGPAPISKLQYPIRLQDKIGRVEKEILSDAFARFRSTRKIAQNLGTSQSSVTRKIKKYKLNQN